MLAFQAQAYALAGDAVGRDDGAKTDVFFESGRHDLEFIGKLLQQLYICCTLAGIKVDLGIFAEALADILHVILLLAFSNLKPGLGGNLLEHLQGKCAAGLEQHFGKRGLRLDGAFECDQVRVAVGEDIDAFYAALGLFDNDTQELIEMIDCIAAAGDGVEIVTAGSPAIAPDGGDFVRRLFPGVGEGCRNIDGLCCTFAASAAGGNFL